MATFRLFLLIVGFISPFQAEQGQTWQLQFEKKKLSLRGLSAIDTRTCWASGSNATVLKTVDGGATWSSVGPEVSLEEVDKLDFRDIEAFDADSAVIMSSGEFDRIYRTDDGGKSWNRVYEHPNRDAFFDGIAFEDKLHGWLMGDPISDRVLILETVDGGKSWSELPASRLPKVIGGEAGFAASGTNLTATSDGCLAIALGGASEGASFDSSRIAITADRGMTWRFVEMPFPRSPSSGLFSLCCVDGSGSEASAWVAVGGDYLKPEKNSPTAIHSDRLESGWNLVTQSPPGGYRSGLASGLDSDGTGILLAVGPNGTDFSKDQGVSWRPLGKEGFHTVDFTLDRTIAWAAGSDGRIAKWTGFHDK